MKIIRRLGFDFQVLRGLSSRLGGGVHTNVPTRYFGRSTTKKSAKDQAREANLIEDCTNSAFWRSDNGVCLFSLSC
ncbi:hypothetical protein IC582_029937 [Cucumis melo]